VCSNALYGHIICDTKFYFKNCKDFISFATRISRYSKKVELSLNTCAQLEKYFSKKFTEDNCYSRQSQLSNILIDFQSLSDQHHLKPS